mmetsp:Transcript_38437/g.46361  ORF Transcript_38437/g.46361 Transcript_38437/m.46361 type:complete len:256 (-) Transcript_38437:1579-2346(-)|eukprot:CAMPEP_0197851234 /NCGR_PEP_ID=MMETSP1438-20131217/17592_1 /TAXON_ID=1461541 /ORGANISM="Pterosperma sp., Strain CCMP1384" /LENGTH=255 /DNA_ID=CAMNT_0043464763 /DNA_START=333 /DNA_END=1100 /DNA_ORIENTATION=+
MADLDEFTEDDVWGQDDGPSHQHQHNASSSASDLDVSDQHTKYVIAEAQDSVTENEGTGVDIAPKGRNIRPLPEEPAVVSTWAPTSAFEMHNAASAQKRGPPGSRRVSNPIAVPVFGGGTPGASGSNKENSSFLIDNDDAHGKEDFVPPHVLAASIEYDEDHIFPASAAADCGLVTHSMTEGSGRTLRGRDAFKLRTAVMRHTGYLERLADEDSTTVGFNVSATPPRAPPASPPPSVPTQGVLSEWGLGAFAQPQ